jgi:hypothetical protein
MFETKTGLRTFATLITIAALTFAASITPASAEVKHASTVRFIASKFVEKKYVEGFSAGKPDFGFTIEALLQLRAAGQSANSFKPAVDFNLRSAANAGISTKVGLLYVDKKFQTGRGGMFLVASKAFALPKSSLSTSVLNSVKAAVSKTGEIADANGNTFIYGWTVLGLKAAGETKLANLVATKLASIARPDGGFGTDLTGDTLTSGSDASGMALMALAAVNKTGTSAQEKAKSAASTKAVNWLTKTALVTDHYEAWGDVDVNGTAYAAMGLSAAGKLNPSIQKWLVSRIAPNGGLVSAYSSGAADIFASAQGYIALLGSSYVSLIK